MEIETHNPILCKISQSKHTRLKYNNIVNRLCENLSQHKRHRNRCLGTKEITYPIVYYKLKHQFVIPVIPYIALKAKFDSNHIKLCT